MAFYEYEGQHYELDTDDPKVAIQKIEAHLGISKGVLESDAMDKFGQGLVRGGEAAVGGLEAAASMVSKTPGFIAGGLMGMGNVMAGQGIEKARESQDTTAAWVDKQLRAFTPQTEFGKVAMEGLDHARSATGDLGGDSPLLRTLNELSFDIGGMAIPAGPAMRGKGGLSPRAQAHLDFAPEIARHKVAEAKAAEAAAIERQANIGKQGEFPADIMDTRQFADPAAMMERLNERLYEEPMMRQREAAGPQADMFDPSSQPFPGVERGQQARLDAMREGVDYDGPGLAEAPKTERLDPFRKEDTDMPFKQEELEFDPYFDTLKKEYDKHMTVHQRNFHNYEKALEKGNEKSASRAADKANEAVANAQKAWDEAKGYMERRQAELGISTPDHYSGSLWADRPDSKMIQKTERPALGTSGPKGSGTRGIEKTPVYRTGKSGRRQGGTMDFFRPDKEQRIKQVNEEIERLSKRVENMEKAAERATHSTDADARLEKLYFEQMKLYNELDRLTNPDHPLNKLGGTGTKGFRQGGAVDFDGFKKQMLDKDPVDLDFLTRRANGLADWIGVWMDTHKNILRQLMDKDAHTIDIADPATGQSHGIPREQAIDFQHKIWERMGQYEKELARIESLETKIENGLFKKQQGSLNLRDPEYLKFKDSLPEPLKGEAKAMWRAMQKRRNEALTATPDVAHNAGSLSVLDDIPGLSSWKDFVEPITKSPEELKPVVLAEPDLSAHWTSRIGRELVSGGKMLGLGTQNTLVRYVAQGVDRVMRESQRAIDSLILSQDTGFKPMWERLSKDEQVQVWAELLQREGKVDLSRQEMFDLGWNEKQVNAAEALRKGLEAVYNRLNEARAAKGKGPVERRLGYIPSRFRGDYLVEARDAEGVLIHKVGANTKLGAERLRKAMEERHPELTFSDVKHEPIHRFKDSSDAQAGYQALLEVLTDEDPRVAQLENIYNEFLNKQAYEAYAMKKHFWDKRGVGGAEGFKEWQDMYTNAQEGLRSVMNYMDHALKWSEAQIQLADARTLLKDEAVQTAQPVASAWAQGYIDQSLGRSTKMARALDTVFDKLAEQTGIGQSLQLKTIREAKYWMTAMYLGFMNAGFSISQIVQTIQMQPALMKVLVNKGAEASVLNSYARGNMDAIRGMFFGRENMTALGREAWEYAKDFGIVEPKILDDAKAWKDMWGSTRAAIDWIATKNMTYFEKMARTQSFMTWVHFLHETGQYKMGKELYELAGQLTDTTMVDYRMHERPMLYKQLGIIGEAANALTTFKHNYYSNMWMLRQMSKDRPAIRDASNKVVRGAQKGAGLAPEATFYMTLFMLGGALSMPFREDIDGILRLFGSPITTRSLLLEAPDLVSFGGASTITGMDLTSKFSAANAVPDDAITAAFPFAGTMGKIVGAGYDAITNPSKASAMRLANQFPPIQRFGGENFFREGDMMLDPKTTEGVYKRQPGDDTARMFGLRSMPESKAMHQNRTIKEQDTYYAGKRASILQKARDLSLNMQDPGITMKLGKLALDYVGAEGEPDAFISHIEGRLERRHLDRIQQMMMETSPQRAKRILGK